MKYLLFALCFLYVSTAYAQQRFDVVIDEIMADPTPPISLPNAEYIELKNISGRELNLQGWRLSTLTAQSGLFPNYVLPADSFVIITTSSNASSFAGYGKVIGVPSFPSLSNDGTTLSLLSKENKLIHFVSYNSSWYQNELKKEGGWSLEMIDTHNPCSAMDNWKASTNNSGGTPGNKNSVDAINKDQTAPQLVNIYTKDPTTIVLQFDDPVDSAVAVNVANYTLQPAVAISGVAVNPAGFSEIEIKTVTGLASTTLYQLFLKGIKDCAGNELSSANSYPLGLPQPLAPADLVINELLFNPKPNGYDYVEFFNRSNKIIDASELYIANRNSSGSIASQKRLSDQSRYIFPGDYLVVAEDPSSLSKNYFVKNSNRMLQLSSLPSLPDDNGTVVIMDINGVIGDEVHYSSDWHFGLLSDEEGVALERIDPDGPSQEKTNWHSAASTAGFGTPTYRNSQYKQADVADANIAVVPKTFSPDNDGIADFVTIQYEVEQAGYVANIHLFDVTGKPVRHLVKNATLGLNGSWIWDGLDEKGLKLRVGNYIIYTELFNLQGKKKIYKNVVVLARRLN